MKYCDHFGFFAPGAFNLESFFIGFTTLETLTDRNNLCANTCSYQLFASAVKMLTPCRCTQQKVHSHWSKWTLPRAPKSKTLSGKNHLKCNKSWPLISIFLFDQLLRLGWIAMSTPYLTQNCSKNWTTRDQMPACCGLSQDYWFQIRMHWPSHMRACLRVHCLLLLFGLN